tara:strand:- start:78633 stop:79517 length:885 start_codon:yes stop_codon:yes gene_type:complete
MSRVTKLIVATKCSDSIISAMKGTVPEKGHYDFMLTSDCNVYNTKGELLLALRKEAFDEEIFAEAYRDLHWLKRMKTDNRGSYSGGERHRRIKKDGTVTNTTWSKMVASATIGYYDRYPRIPYCRQTAFMSQQPERWGRILPLIQDAASIFKKNIPDKYKIQEEFAKNCHPEWVIPKTPFTTVTVNNCVVSRYHTDKGDFKGGFGLLGCFRKGNYRGFELVIPEYKIAVDLGHRDLLFFNPHLWHGNAEPYDCEGEQAKDWERITMVFYFREKMIKCLDMKSELERAKKLRGSI